MKKRKKLRLIRNMEGLILVLLWIAILALFHFLYGLSALFKPAVPGAPHLLGWVASLGLMAALTLGWIGYMLYAHYSSNHEWEGSYHEFNGVQLRIRISLGGEKIFDWDDVADALEIRDARDRQRQLLFLQKSGHIMGDAPDCWVTSAGIKAILDRKTNRNAILFRKYLEEIETIYESTGLQDKSN
ncbi:MAG: hypothetical protein RL748_1021 [Pseudomonadota bacterium]